MSIKVGDKVTIPDERYLPYWAGEFTVVDYKEPYFRISNGAETGGFREGSLEVVPSTAALLAEARKRVEELEEAIVAEAKAKLPRIPTKPYAMIRIKGYLPIVLSPDNDYEGWVFVNGWGAKNRSNIFRTNEEVQELADGRGFVVMYEGEEA